METTRKEWGNPTSKVQVFTPQEFVAACETPIGILPAGLGNKFYIDGYGNGGDKCNTNSKNGKYDGTESVTSRDKSFDGGLEKLLQTYPNAHVVQAYSYITGSYKDLFNDGSLPGSGLNYSATYFTKHVLIHAYEGSQQFFYLSDGDKGSDDPWDYIKPGTKNNS